MLGKSRIQNYLIFVVVFFLLFTTISSAEGVKGLSFWQTGGILLLVCLHSVRTKNVHTGPSDGQHSVKFTPR